MHDPFTNLKSALKKTVFHDFSFSNERKNAVKETISRKHLHCWNEETIFAVLKIIQHGQKHGYDISTELFQKRELAFQHDEGQLYTLLHLLENKAFLSSMWVNEKKYYFLNSKGKKYVATYEQTNAKQRFSLKSLLEEASL